MLKAVVVFILILACAERVASLVTMGSACTGEHCHWQTHEEGEEEERAVLYWLTGDSCYKVGEYNPFYEEEPPKFCPEGTEMFWKDPEDWTAEERASLGLEDVDVDDLVDVNI